MHQTYWIINIVIDKHIVNKCSTCSFLSPPSCLHLPRRLPPSLQAQHCPLRSSKLGFTSVTAGPSRHGNASGISMDTAVVTDSEPGLLPPTGPLVNYTNTSGHIRTAAAFLTQTVHLMSLWYNSQLHTATTTENNCLADLKQHTNGQ